MEGFLSRAPISGQRLARLLVNGQPAAIVGPVRQQTAKLFTSYYGRQWKWWALISGVKGGTWLVRNLYRDRDCPLLLEPSDEPTMVKSSWDSPTPERPKIRTSRGRKARV